MDRARRRARTPTYCAGLTQVPCSRSRIRHRQPLRVWHWLDCAAHEMGCSKGAPVNDVCISMITKAELLLGVQLSRCRSAAGRLLRRLRADLHRIGAVAVAEGRGVDLFELDLAGEHLALPGLLLGDAGVEFGHDLSGEELEALANVRVGVFAGLVWESDWVDMRVLDAPQLAPQGLGRADQPAGERA